MAEHDRPDIMSSLLRRNRRKSRVTNPTEDNSEFADNHPVRVGQELFAKATLIELDEQVRAADADTEH